MEAVGVGPLGKRPLKEVVTPHKLSMLALIREYTLAKSKAIQTTMMEADGQETGFSQKQMRDFMTIILKLLQSPDLQLKELLTMLTGVLKTSLQTAFEDRLKEFYCDGVGPMMDFSQAFADMLNQEGEGTIVRSSVLGLFVRRMILAFEKLTFSQVMALYAQYKAYYETVHALTPTEEGTADLGQSVADPVDLSTSLPSFSNKSNLTKNLQALSLHEGYGKEVTSGFYSQKQAEYFITQQVFLLQHNENEAMSPAKLQEKVSEMLTINPDLAEAHFLSYLNNLRVKEYCTAMHNLYHYFDRHAVISPDTGSSSKVKDEDVGRRYAALNLAALHFRFGHRQESMAALREAIRMAQEANDHICLQHALGWLYRLGEQGTGGTANLMERSVAKSGELNLPYLTSLGVQALARNNALATAKPSSVFEFLLKSDILNCQHSQSGFMCVSYAQKSALWHMYGKREMCSTSSQLVLNLDTSDCGIYHNGESGCVAMCSLAKHQADKGRYAAAFEIIKSAKKRYTSTSQYAHIWMACEQEITFTKAVLAGDWSTAEDAVHNLKAVSLNEADIRQALLLKEKGETTLSFNLIRRLLARCDQENIETTELSHATQDYKCRVLLLLSELYCQTGCPMVAITHLLECLTLAKEHHLQYLASLTGVYLAYVQFYMLLPSQGQTILDEHMVTVLSHGSVYDQAKVLYLYAKCQVAAVDKGSHPHRKSALLSAVSTLTTVTDMFKSVEAHRRVKDAMYYQARLYHDLGYIAERNKCSLKFRQLDQQYPTLSPLLVNGV